MEFSRLGRVHRIWYVGGSVYIVKGKGVVCLCACDGDLWGEWDKTLLHNYAFFLVITQRAPA
jgi:hypothetical protein